MVLYLLLFAQGQNIEPEDRPPFNLGVIDRHHPILAAIEEVPRERFVPAYVPTRAPLRPTPTSTPAPEVAAVRLPILR